MSASSSTTFWTDRVWISSFNINIIKYFRIYQVTSEEESDAEALVPATVSVSVTCDVTNHVKVNSLEIFSNPHLVSGLFISLRHCDDLHRIWSVDLLTATVRFDALNESNSFRDSLIFSCSSNRERTYSLHDRFQGEKILI